MLVLIDESGCPGFKLGKGSTPYFVVAMIIFDDLLSAEKTSKNINELRENLKVKPEFKFNKSSNNIRDAFFEMVIRHKFKVRALVVEKRKIYSPDLRDEKQNFYNFFVRNLMTYDGKVLDNAIVKIDGSGNKIFQKERLSYLRSQIGGNKVKKFKTVDSKKDNLIQLADMAVGAIARSYNEKRKDSDRWLKMLRPRIDNIWFFE